MNHLINEEDKDKVASLLKYLKAVDSLKKKTVTDVKRQSHCRFFDEIPENKDYIHISYRDSYDSIGGLDDAVEDIYGGSILRVQKPPFHPCPTPPESIRSWLNLGWDDANKEASIYPSKEFRTGDRVTTTKHFEDDADRVQDYEIWRRKRDDWVEERKRNDPVWELFLKLYNVYLKLQSESEVSELMVGNGLLQDTRDSSINHPILLKKVSMTFNPGENVITIDDTDTDPELFVAFLNNIEDIDTQMVGKARNLLVEKGCHPLDRHEGRLFLNSAIHSMCPESLFLKEGEKIPAGSRDKIILSERPVFFIRKKSDGLENFINETINAIDKTGEIPNTFLNVVGSGTHELAEEEGERSIEKRLAEVGGEDPDILLAKPANREQLDIARQIENHDAVLVQGPPGTGKTHTIANLMGHFLAKGERVLVTSYTRKALSVLKEKMPEKLQDLCVSVLDDSNEDMERSVDGITEMSAHSSTEFKNKADKARNIRRDIMKELSDTRRRLYQIKFKECSPVVYSGESLSPLEMAKFVHENEDTLSYIPGKVALNRTLPLSFEELSQLYHSNTDISPEDEQELANELPNPESFVQPERFKIVLERIAQNKKDIKRLADKLDASFDLNTRVFTRNNGEVLTPGETTIDAIHQLKKWIDSLGQFEEWSIHAIVDGKNGGGARKKWVALAQTVHKAQALAAEFGDKYFDKVIEFSDDFDEGFIIPTLTEIKEIYASGNTIGWLKRKLNKRFDKAENMVSINGNKVATAEDCEAVLLMIQVRSARQECARFWDDLLMPHGVPAFMSLNDGRNPENKAAVLIAAIPRYLNWYAQEFSVLIKLLANAGLTREAVFQYKPLDSDTDIIRKVLKGTRDTLPELLAMQEALIQLKASLEEMRSMRSQMDDVFVSTHSALCMELYDAFLSDNCEEYTEKFGQLSKLYGKYANQNLREELLRRLEEVAPKWADNIRNREGEFGEDKVPENVEDAWRWKQYVAILDDLTSESFADLQQDSLRLSREYRAATEELVVNSAWYHLLRRTEGDGSLQSLQGWRQITKKIGKGTGKNAPRYRREARDLMNECKDAVPAWIMTLNRVLTNFVPNGEPQFDVLIIDEASQASVTALPVFFLAKKIIVVGDDKQVSPLAVGANSTQVNALQDVYLKGKVKNPLLYSPDSSLYDIAKTVFHPVMLREHFRCVPDIIGYSNLFNYDGKIKPLRDTRDCNIVPAVINYRTPGHQDPGGKKKINEIEG